MDYLRVIGLVTIVIIHSLNYFFSLPATNSISQDLQGLAINLFRYGRFVFMFVTGLVFFYTYNNKEIKIIRFFKRRLSNLVIPYVIWSAIYLFLSRSSNMVNWSDMSGFIRIWFYSLLNGNAFYHLYYIIVSIQFYVFFPFLLILFKPTHPRRCAGILLVSGFFLSIIYYYILESQGPIILSLVTGTPWEGITEWLLKYKNHMLFSYLPFYLLGGLFGLYLEECRKWISHHTSVILISFIVGVGTISSGYFYSSHYLGEPWNLTVSVFKPTFYIYSLAAIATLFWLSSLMERKGTLKKLISILSASSLGIYLMHPAVLFFLHTFYLWSNVIPEYLLVFLDPILAILICWLISYLLGCNKYTCFVIGKANNLHIQQRSWRSFVLKLKNSILANILK